MIELYRTRESAHACPYLAGRTASLEYRFITALTGVEYEALLRRGWRRFGRSFFRPACPDCTACRSLRVPVRTFRPSRSQRRTLQRNAAVRVVVQPPTLTDGHIQLYRAYHEDMHRRRGWPLQTVTASDYAATFLAGDWGFACEFLYFRENRLVGVGLADVAEQSLSSVYFYHDPAWRPSGPGVFSILTQLRYAADHNLRYQYLGYWIPDCPSMAYKSNYRPHEVLVGLPPDHDEPAWLRPSEAASPGAPP